MGLNSLPQLEGGFLVIGDGADFYATSASGDWPATTALIIESAAGMETSFAPTLATTTATWALTVAEVTALIGTKTAGQGLRYRVTTGSGDTRRGRYAGTLTILTKWIGQRAAQSLGTVIVGPPGPGVASAAIDADGDLVLTLDDATTLPPVTVPALADALAAAVAADASADAAALSESAAAASASTATTQAGIATTQAGNAAASAVAAAASASTASGHASTATTQAGNAAASALAAAASEAAAGLSETAAGASETAAAASAAAASGFASAASNDADAAATSAAAAAASQAATEAVDIAIGTVTTGAVGSSAAAAITGTAPNFTLNLTLPTGATGATGTAAFSLTNIKTNGNLATGDTTGWLSSNAGTPAVVDGAIRFTATAAPASAITTQHVYQSMSVTTGRKYYGRARVKGATTCTLQGSSIVLGTVTVADTWQTLSGIYDATVTGTRAFGVRDTATSGWAAVDVDNMIWIDLTSRFGAGAEPTAAEMNTLIDGWLSGYVAGTVNDVPFLGYLAARIAYLQAQIDAL